MIKLRLTSWIIFNLIFFFLQGALTSKGSDCSGNYLIYEPLGLLIDAGIIDVLLSDSSDSDSEPEQEEMVNEHESNVALQSHHSFNNAKERSKWLMNQIKETCRSQHPDGISYNPRHYEIVNFPEGIDQMKSRWTCHEMNLIEGKIDELVFIKRPFRFSLEQQLGMERLPNLNGILVKEMTKPKTQRILLERYRIESGEADAKHINWNLLDRRDIPAKYENIPINSFSMSLTKFFKNPEIVSNIHFFQHDSAR